MHIKFARSAIVGAALCSFLAAPAMAETVSYKADLKGSSEVPSNDTKGTGSVDASLDTTSKKFTYTITYSGLTGPASAAHFHGPAEAGKNAPPVVPIANDKLASPIKGETTLTDALLTDLNSGKLYFNVHTAVHKDGEIRGQVMKK
jgi:hypothetical protein